MGQQSRTCITMRLSVVKQREIFMYNVILLASHVPDLPSLRFTLCRMMQPYSTTLHCRVQFPDDYISCDLARGVNSGLHQEIGLHANPFLIQTAHIGSHLHLLLFDVAVANNLLYIVAPSLHARLRLLHVCLRAAHGDGESEAIRRTGQFTCSVHFDGALVGSTPSTSDGDFAPIFIVVYDFLIHLRCLVIEPVFFSK